MKIDEYREYLQRQSIPGAAIEKHMAIIGDFVQSLTDLGLGHASHYLAGLDQELIGEVLESAVKGDTRCRFVFYLPHKDNNA